MRRDLLVAALLDAEFEDQELSFSEAAIRRYYDAHQDDFRRLRPEIKARHILLTSQREANTRRQTLLQRGESFSEMARKYSQDAATRNEGGELGYFSEVEDPVLWAACQDLRLKVISEPVQTEYGYHLIQILERCEPARSATSRKCAPRSSRYWYASIINQNSTNSSPSSKHPQTGLS